MSEEALNRARAEALEEAAKWHDKEAEFYDKANGLKDGVPFFTVAVWHREHAAAIRALKE
ncbi:MAG: hypothetical protein QNJ16_20025 [Rhodobacter sp.]|nr:hypothetical protein [Rhodobacter sp.]